jgi:hypothetical protein
VIPIVKYSKDLLKQVVAVADAERFIYVTLVPAMAGTILTV